MAWPVHFSEPSGQYARGQDCRETRFASAVLRSKLASRLTAPRGQGTPQLTPCDTAGGDWSSQFNFTSEASAATAVRTTTTTANTARQRSIFIRAPLVLSSLRGSRIVNVYTHSPDALARVGLRRRPGLDLIGGGKIFGDRIRGISRRRPLGAADQQGLKTDARQRRVRPVLPQVPEHRRVDAA